MQKSKNGARSSRMPDTKRPEIADHTRSTMFEFARCLGDSGWLRDRDVANLDIIERSQYPGGGEEIVSPIMQINDRTPDFYLYWDVLGSYGREFAKHLDGIDPILRERLPSTYSAAVALGGFALKRQILDPHRDRSARKLSQIRELYADNTDFTQHFKAVFGGTPLERTMTKVLDRFSMQLNGLRSGLTVMRAAMQEQTGHDFMTDELLAQCLKSLIEYATVDGTHYEGAAEYFGQTRVKGVEVFSYAIPEWLLVLSFPMGTEKVEVLMQD